MIISNLPIDLGRVKQNYSTDNENRPLLMSGVAGVSSTSDRGSNESVVNNSIYANPSTGTIHADIDFPITEEEIEAIFNGTANNEENTEPSNEEPVVNNEPESGETSGEENGSSDPENTEGSSEEGGESS